jgi:hypothetical protein
LGSGVVDAYLKHRESTPQFDRAWLSAFLGAELGLSRPSIAKPRFGQLDRSAEHSESVVIGGNSHIWLP